MSTQEIKLKAIADAIRAKDGTTEPIVANDFPARILAIQTGGGSLPDNVRTITLTAEPEDGGTVSGGGMASDGMTITVNAVPLNGSPVSGYALSGWYEGEVQVSADRNYTFTVNGNRTLTARFEESQIENNGNFVGIYNYNTKKIAVSSDLVSWEESDITQILTDNNCPNAYPRAVTFFQGRFIVLVSSSSGPSLLLQSTDGKIWTEVHEIPAKGSRYEFTGLSVAGEYLCVYGNYGMLIYTQDLVNFYETTKGNSSYNTIYIRDVKKRQDGMYYLVQDNGYSYYASVFPNFSSYVMSGPTVNNVSYGFFCAAFNKGDGYLYAGSGRLGYCYRTKGTSWSSVTPAVIINNLGRVKDGFIQISNSGSARILKDGTTSYVNTQGSVGGTIIAKSLSRGGGKLVIGTTGNPKVSLDEGDTWQEIAPDISFVPKIFAYSAEGGYEED